MTHRGPLVSVITPFHNPGAFFDDAIASVIAQTYTDWELILVDDGSTDGSGDIARRYAQRDGRIRYVTHEGGVNRGISASRNLALRHARGEYVAFIDADDVYLPDKLARQVTVLESNPDVGLLYGSTLYWYEWDASATRRDWAWTHFGVAPDAISPGRTALLHFLRDRATLPCMGSLLVRKRLVDDVGGFEERFRGLFEDQAFLVKACLATPVYVSSDCLDRYRQHRASLCYRSSPDLKRRSLRQYERWLRTYLGASRNSDPELWQAVLNARRSTKRFDPLEAFHDAFRIVRSTALNLLDVSGRRRR